MARVKEQSAAVATSQAIDRLIGGDYDTPIREAGLPRSRLTLGKLNVLRMRMRDERDESNKKEESLKMEIASVAHDLKTPLTVISGYVECMQDGLDDKDYLSLIGQTAEQMNKKVQDFVESMRGAASNEEKPEKINVREFFVAECDKYKNLAENLGIKLKIGRIPKVTVYCKKKDLATILQNLMSNAFKYCGEQKKVRLTFSSMRKKLSIKVKDWGIGIKKSDLPHIFDRFYMSDKSRSVSDSSGLGLYIVKNVVENMNGKIFVKSKENKGTTFRVVLPWESDDMDVQLSHAGKFGRFLITLLFGWATASIVRFVHYARTGNVKFLIAGFVLIPFFFVGWFADMMSVAITGKYTLLMND